MIEHFISQKLLPLFAFLNLALIILFLVLSTNTIFKEIKKIKEKTLIWLLIILLIALSIRLFLVTKSHIFLIDESFYISSAKNIVLHFKSFMATGDYPKPIGWPVLLAVPFFFFGISNYTAIYTSTFFGAASVLLIFIITYLLLEDERTALFSSLFIAILPIYIVYSGTAETAAASLFFIFATIASFLLMQKYQKYSLVFLTLFIFTFSIQIRLENALLVIPLLYLFYLKPVNPILRKFNIFILSIFPFFILFIFQYIQLRNFYNNVYYKKLTFFSINVAGAKTLELLKIENYFILFFMLIILLIGICFLYKNNKQILFFFLLFCLTYFLYYSIYVYSDDFHMMPGIAALVPVMAYGTSSILDGLSKSLNYNRSHIDFFFVIFVLIFFIGTFKSNAKPEFILETQVINKLKTDIPENCIVVSEVPAIVSSVTELKSVDTIDFLDKTAFSMVPYKDRCTLYFEDAYCYENLLPKSLERCKKLHDKFILNIFRNYTYKNATFIVYNITGAEKSKV